MSTPGATARASRMSPTNNSSLSTNTPGVNPVALPLVAPVSDSPTNTTDTSAVTVASAPTVPDSANAPAASSAPELSSQTHPTALYTRSFAVPGWLIGQFFTLLAVGGFIAYFCGLTRAKNCGHTCTVILLGVMFGLAGFWISGFAVQTGGLGDVHAALPMPVDSSVSGGLDHELEFPAGGHHYGFMGSAGFFLSTDTETRNGTATLFLEQAVLLAIAVAIALGGVLERVRIISLAIGAFLIGALIYPLFANWVWGGGWLAELGREADLGHGVVDLAGAGVIHLTAGTLALVFTLELGPRYGRFGRNSSASIIPGHNVPFTILGCAAILLALTALNTQAYFGAAGEDLAGGLAATNTLLGAAGGILAAFFYAAYKGRRTDPSLLCRGLIGGAVAISAGSALLDPWAAFLIGVIAAGVIQTTVGWLERRRIDDPVGVVAVHGAGGAWGLIAVGLFADSTSGSGINGVSGPVRGLLLGHDGHQLAAQLLGCVTCVVVVFALGYGCVSLIQKIVGIRVDVTDETIGLDWPKLGVLGYQADAEVEREP